jgi:hypothetical protein
MGAPSTLPERVVADRLVATVTGLILGGSANGNTFAGPEQPPSSLIPHSAVFCVCYSGEATPYLGTGTDARSFAVQVLIRGNVEDYEGAATRAYLCWQTLQRFLPVVTGYIDCLCMQGGPVYIGKDDTEHPRFVVNVNLRYKG